MYKITATFNIETNADTMVLEAVSEYFGAQGRVYTPTEIDFMVESLDHQTECCQTALKWEQSQEEYDNIVEQMRIYDDLSRALQPVRNDQPVKPFQERVKETLPQG